MTLLDQIINMQRTVSRMKQALALEEAALRELEHRRIACEHEWGPAVKNYEHEGRCCKLCGINDIYAHTLQTQANWSEP